MSTDMHRTGRVYVSEHKRQTDASEDVQDPGWRCCRAYVANQLVFIAILTANIGESVLTW